MPAKILLIDGSNFMFRAYHATLKSQLTNRAGHPTGAIYSMVNMLRRAQQSYPADYLACVFDAKGQNFRHTLYPEYKANRQEMPDELRVQIPVIHQMVQAMGWNLIIQAGVEADDVIGTLAHQAQQQGIEVMIGTGDKDMAQLVNEHVILLDTMANTQLDVQGVVDKFAVQPTQMVDYLILLGDSSDNIPGVAGWGKKTAAKFLQQYGSLSEIWAHRAEIKGVVGKNLCEAEQLIHLNRQLITIKTDCVLEQGHQDLAQLTPKPLDYPALQQLVDEYDLNSFKSWAYPDGQVQPASTPIPVLTQQVLTPHNVAELVTQLNSATAVAFYPLYTGDSPVDYAIYGLALAMGDCTWYIPLGCTDLLTDGVDSATALKILQDCWQNPQIQKITHNLKALWHGMHHLGLSIGGADEDVMLQAYVLSSASKTELADCVAQYLDQKLETPKDLTQLDSEAQAQYAMQCAHSIAQLYPVLQARLSAQDETIYALEKQVAGVLMRMEQQGIALDIACLQQIDHSLTAELSTLQQAIFAYTAEPFNLNSPSQLATVLYSELNLPVLRKTPKGSPSTDEDTLTELAKQHPLPKLLLRYRTLSKLQNTYTSKLALLVCPKTQRIHTTYLQTSAYTGRLASIHPNLQNIPIRTPEGRRIREAFVASPGCQLLSADYSQIELRIMAHLSADPQLLFAFEHGLDIHQATAAEVLNVPIEMVTPEQRRYAKAINFGLIYGMSAFGLSNTLDISVSEAKNYMETYFQRYPKIATFMAYCKELAAKHGYVETVFGRRIWVPNIHRKGPAQAAAQRVAINAPMQGTAADLIKKAMIVVDEFLSQADLQSRLLLQVHDELIIDAHHDEIELLSQKIPALMASVATLRVPLIAQVGVGHNWEQAH